MRKPGGFPRLAATAALLLLGTACEASVATSTVTTLRRNAFLGHAVTCNASPFIDTMPPRTELGSMLDCLGWQEWLDERDLQLDVVRYGTIVKRQAFGERAVRAWYQPRWPE